jgi:hypothetical protein
LPTVELSVTANRFTVNMKNENICLRLSHICGNLTAMAQQVAYITAANARELQRRSTESRKRNIIAAQTTPKEDEITVAVKQQITEVLAEMGRTKSKKEKARLTVMLERLWNLVFPKAGARKPGRDTGRRNMPQLTGDQWSSVPQLATDVATEPGSSQNPQ